MERTFTLALTQEEEKQFQELCTLYKEYQERKGWENYEHAESDMLSLWISQGLTLHLLENYNFLRSVMLESTKKGEEAA